MIIGLAEPVCVAEQIGCNSMEKVGAGFVAVAVMTSICQCVLDHVAGSGLSVSSRDNDDFHIFSRNGENIARDLHCYSAGQGCTSSAGLAKNSADQFA